MLWYGEERTLSQADSAVSFSKPVSSFRESTGTIIAELSMPSTKPSSHFCAGRRHFLSHHTRRPDAVSCSYSTAASAESDATR